MAYSFSFTCTTEDLLDAQAAHATLTSALRPLFRIPLVILGLLWASGPIWALVLPTVTFSIGGLIMWFAGCAIVWQNLVRPILDRRRIKKDPIKQENVVVEFGDEGITINAPPATQIARPWAEVVDAVSFRKGLLLRFTDGVVNWLPRRVFPDDRTIADLRSLVNERTAKAKGL